VRKCLVLVLTILFLLSFMPFNAKNTQAISASSYCVIDSVTGRILYEKNAHTKRGMASTTKIMTAIVALENSDINSVATVSRKASYTEGSSLYLKAGEKMKVIDLVYGLMLNSGNDAAVVLAEHIGGSVENFANMMNETAQKIGAVSTSFTNPNGLYDDNHYTTAYELALITRYALKNEQFRQIVSTKKYTAQTVGDARKIYLSNHNKLLGSFDGCDGIKTGFTKKTGRCLVSSVTRDGWQAICVTLNAADDWNDHKTLINKAFSEYKMQKLVSKGQYLKTLPVLKGVSDLVGAVAGDSVCVPIKENEKIDFEMVYNLPENLDAPVVQGQLVGSVNLLFDKKAFASLDVIANASVEITKKASYFYKLVLILRAFI